MTGWTPGLLGGLVLASLPLFKLCGRDSALDHRLGQEATFRSSVGLPSVVNLDLLELLKNDAQRSLDIIGIQTQRRQRELRKLARVVDLGAQRFR